MNHRTAQRSRGGESPVRGVFPLALLLALALGVLDAPTARALAAEPVRASSLLHAALGTQGESISCDIPLQVAAITAPEAGFSPSDAWASRPTAPRLACRRGESGLAPPCQTRT